MRHKVTINVSRNGGAETVLQSSRESIRSKLLDLILGKSVGLLVITPGDSVETVEIKEIKGGEHGEN